MPSFTPDSETPEYWKEKYQVATLQLDRIYSLLGVKELPQIDAAIASIQELMNEASEYQTCSDFAANVFDALEVDYTSEEQKLFDAIARLKNEALEWRTFGLEACAKLNIPANLEEEGVPLIDSVDAALDNIRWTCSEIECSIARWIRETFDESWNEENLKIAAHLVRQLLIAVRGRDDLSEGSELIPMITPLVIESGKLEPNSSPASLRDAIAGWVVESLKEDWSGAFVGIAEGLTKQLLGVIRGRNSLAELQNAESLIKELFALLEIRVDLDRSQQMVLSIEQPGLRGAISAWAKNCGENWGLVRLSIAEDLVKRVLTAVAQMPHLSGHCRVVIERDGTSIEGLKDNAENRPYADGVYQFTQGADGNPEAHLICDAQDWQRFSEQIERAYNLLSVRGPRSTTFGKLQEVLNQRNTSELAAIVNLKAFQEDVLIWFRALSMVASTVANCTHREKDARLRGMIELIETSAQQARDSQAKFVEGHWQRPDIFRSDFPVKRYRDRIRELEVEVAKLKGEPSPVEDIPF